MLTNPLRDRFGIVNRLEFCSPEDLALCGDRRVCLESRRTKVGPSKLRRSRDRVSPLLRRVRDYVEVKGNGEINQAMAHSALTLLEVDEAGFDMMDRKLLDAVIYKFDGGPVGVEKLAAAIGSRVTPLKMYLIQQGYLQRTPRGRMATAAAWHHCGLSPKATLPPLSTERKTLKNDAHTTFIDNLA